MVSINNDFLGHNTVDCVEDFLGSDSKFQYQQNLKIQPEDWFYRNNTISYVLNNNGHRCKNIEDIDLDNYILFAGCSRTEGIGLRLEDTYSYLLSKKLNCDYYNLALEGSGADVLNYNIVMWFTKIKKPPKLLIVQWPHYARTIGNINNHEFKNYGMWDSSAHRFFDEGEQLGIFKSTRILTKNIIKNIICCPIIELVHIHDKLYKNELTILEVDWARDKSSTLANSGHPGIKSNLLNTEKIYNEINDLEYNI